jgi:hypothetical protein
MTKQRGIAENDQRSRSFILIIKGDLDKRTFRYMMPFAANENTIADGRAIPTVKRQGYFSISENDPNNNTDDILQFTVRSTVRLKNADDTPYYGHATLYLNLPWGDANGDGTINGIDLFSHPNQPEADDGQIAFDATSNSSAAEVSYFLRNGNLYRRVLLIREPLPLAGENSQPTLSNGFDLFDRDPDNNPATPTPGAVYSGDFWTDYDFSAFYHVTPPGPSIHGAHFHGIASLANEVPGGGLFPLAKPFNRFGHSHATGNPREYFGANGGGAFLGRFTHEETSHPAFNYPHDLATAPAANTNPMNRATALADTTPANGVPDAYELGPRMGEDLLLGHVQSFDVKIWDDGYIETDSNGNGQADPAEDYNGNGVLDFAGAFVDVGHAYPVGRYRNSQKVTTLSGGGAYLYGPSTTAANNRIYDTWHPQVDLDGDGIPDPPPFRPAADNGKDGQPGRARIDDNADSTTDDAGETGWWGSDDLHPLQAIQITVRFLDVSSNQIRQVTFVHSLVD